MKIDYLSYSKLRLYDSCPRAFAFRYAEGVIGIRSKAMDIGKNLHKAIELYHRSDDKLDAFLASLSDQEKEAFSLYTKRYKRIPGELVEEDFEVRFLHPDTQKKIGIPLRVIIDRITDGVIYDYKIGRSWDQKMADQSMQFTLYALAYYERWGKLPKSIRVVNIVLQKQPFIKEFETSRDFSHFAYAYEWAKTKLVAIYKDLFYATPGIHCRWCPFREVCLYKLKVK